MDKILPYYERELATLRRHMREFARQYPKLAGRLQVAGDMVEDPHIERLIQAFSLVAARIDKKIDDSQKRFAAAILDVVFPDYLRPYPSCSIAEFTPNVDLKLLVGEKLMPRLTQTKTRVIGRGVSLGFRTTQDVRFLPLQIESLAWRKVLPDQHRFSPDLNGCFRLELMPLNESLRIDHLLSRPLRLYIDAHPGLTVSLREILTRQVKNFSLQIGAQTFNGDGSPFQTVGLTPDTALLPDDSRILKSSRLLQEYFVFPDKFAFVDLDLSSLARQFGSVQPMLAPGQPLTLQFFFRHDPNEIQLLKMFEQVDARTLKLFCSPVVNLVKVPGTPVKLNHQKAEFELTPATLQPSYFELYSVEQVTHVQDEQNQLKTRQFYPYFNLSHANAGARDQYYQVYRDEQTAQFQPGYEYRISITDNSFDATLNASQALSTELECTNRDLPATLKMGHQYGDLFPDQSADFKFARLLRRPTPTYRFDNHVNEGEWRMISKLSIDAVSLCQNQGEPLRELLLLHNPTPLEENSHKIESLLDCRARPVRRRILSADHFPVFCQGVEVDLSVDEKKLAGSGIQLFAEVLGQVLAYLTPLNTFVQVVIFNRDFQKELMRCQPKSGQQVLL